VDEILHVPQEAAGQTLTGVPRLPDVGQALRKKLGGARQALRQKWDVFHRDHAALVHRADEVLYGRKMAPLPFLAAMSVVGIAAVIGTVYTPSYVVSVDGVPLGLVEHQQDFEAAVERVESRASAILGYDYHVDSEITYQFALSEQKDFPSTSIFETYLLNQIGEVMKSYVLSVDGQVIGATVDRADIEALLERVQAPYVNENTQSVRFLSNIQIIHEYAPSSLEQDPDALFAALTADNEQSTTYAVQPGDTFMALAYANGMDMDEMEALNPGIDINKLIVGQELVIHERVPVLSVQTVERVTYTQSIPFSTEQVKDSSLYVGETRVTREGSAGERLITADVTYQNGYEKNRDILTEEVVSEPVSKIVAVGTKEKPVQEEKTSSSRSSGSSSGSAVGKGSFIWPVRGTITSRFGGRSIFGSYSYHRGIDIATGYGTPIVAADSGKVVFAGAGKGSSWSYGNYVLIDHGNGKQTLYAHCSSVLVRAGQTVSQGQTIARVGSTGRSTGNHCHFEVRVGGKLQNPLSYLR